ncbi:MAG: argininosuccinate lyase [Vicinamibacteria bacterium]|nr:argininosuccinate lyase [Vicinamibacteria bacterium]
MNLTKKSLSLLGLGLALTVAISAGLVWAGDQDFVLINKTGYDIDEVYVAPAHQKTWGDDVMDQDTLDNGQNVTIEFAHKEKDCVWDMRIVFSDGEEAIWEGFDLCTIHQITLRYAGKRPTAEVK